MDVLLLHRMRESEGEGLHFRKERESVVPFGEGQWKETLVNSDGSPTEACWVYSTHTQLRITHPVTLPGVLQYYVSCHKRMKLLLPLHLQQLVTGCLRVTVCV